MNERLEYQQLECYKLANDMQKEKLNREPYFDLGKLPGKTASDRICRVHILPGNTGIHFDHKGRKDNILTAYVNFFRSHPIRKTACLTEKKTSG